MMKIDTIGVKTMKERTYMKIQIRIFIHVMSLITQSSIIYVSISAAKQ